MKKQYLTTGNHYQVIDDNSHIINELPVGVYQIKKGLDGFYLDKIMDKFQIAPRSYDISDGLKDRIIKYWKYTQSSMGVLFSGVKGCGKSYLAKQIGVELQMPVILVTQYIEGINDFIGTISGRAIIVFDEFEKIFDKDEQQTMLSVVDGMYSASVDDIKMFIFTVNDEWGIDSNFLGRPGRIRYWKRFISLSPELIESMVNDQLQKDLDKKDEIIAFLSTIKQVTIDVICAVLTEINMFGFNPEFIKENLNIQFSSFRYKCRCSRYHTMTAAEFFEEYNKFKDPSVDGGIEFSVNTVVSTVPWDKLKVGQKFDDERIVYIDHANKFISVIDEDDDVLHYIIEQDMTEFNLAY